MRTTRRLALALAFLGAAAALWAGPSVSETNMLVPSDTGGGGSMQAPGGSYLMTSGGVLDVITSSAAAPGAGTRVYPGLQNLISWPRLVTDLAARADVTASSVTLTWSAPGLDQNLGALRPGDRYILRVASYTTPYTFVSTATEAVTVSTDSVVPGAAVGYAFAGLMPNTTYFARIWTVDFAGNISYGSPRSTFTTLATSPRRNNFVPPTDFLGVFATSATVRWGAHPEKPPEVDSMTAQGYTVEASSTDFGAFLPGGEVASSTTYHVSESTLTVLGLTSGTTWYFRVAALNWVGLSSYTVLGSTRTPLEARLPGTLVSTYTFISSYSATVAWGDNGNPASTVYTLESALDEVFTLDKLSSTTYSTSFELGRLAANTTHYFRVRAATEASTSDWRVFLPTSTLAAEVLPPAEPFPGVHVSSADVAWYPGDNPVNFSSYSVVMSTSIEYSSDDPANVFVVGNSTMPQGSELSARLVGLQPNTTYYAFAASLNWSGRASRYVLLGSTSTRADTPAVAAPTVLESHFSSMTVQWSASGNPLEVTTYTVALSTSLSFPNVFAETVFLATAPVGAVQATPTGLLLNTTYHVFVRAIDRLSRPSPYAFVGSTCTQGVAPAVLPDAPTYTELSTAGFTLNWASGTAALGFNNDRTSYSVHVALNASFAPVVWQSSFSVAISSVANTLSPNTTYYARVAAFEHHIGTWTAYTDFGSTSTLAAAPSAVSVPFVDVEQTSMTALWGRAGNPVDVSSYTAVLSPESAYPNSNPLNQVLSTSPAGAFPTGFFSGLVANSTYYLHASALNHNGVPSDFSLLQSTSTRALEPPNAAVAVEIGSVTLSWDPISADGYRLEASSNNFGALPGNAPLHYTTTPVNGAVSMSLDGLVPNTTYYLKLASLNWNSVPTEIRPSSAATLARQVSGAMLYRVFETSAVVNWHDLPPSPDSATAGGYVVEAATADALGSGDFGGVLISSLSYGVGLSTLTLTGLEPGTTYIFRVGALNWQDRPHYAVAGSSNTRIAPMDWDGGGGDNNWFTAKNWNPDGLPGPGTPVTIGVAANVRVMASSPTIRFSSMTLGSPGGAVVSLTVSTTVWGGDVLIYGGAGLTQASTHQWRFDGDFTMQAGSTLSHQTNLNVTRNDPDAVVNIRVNGLFDLRSGALIEVSTRGFTGGTANCAAVARGPGFGSCDSGSAAGGGGGGHGGAGGNAGPAVVLGGAAYDAALSTQPGSGGGGGDTTGTGGHGGGAVILRAERVFLDGRIQANGTAGGPGNAGNANQGAGGGGAGGAVNIRADFFEGAGVIQSTGASGGPDSAGGDDPGGGGGGGRVALDIAQGGNICSVVVSTHGGLAGATNSTDGGGGTFFSTVTLAVPVLSAVYSTSDTVHWTWTASTGGLNYRLYDSGDSPVSPALGASVTFYTETGLLPNTTYQRYVQVFSCGYSSNSVTQGFATLASTVTALAQADTFLQVGETFIKAAWVSLLDAPEPATSKGYRLEVSSRADFQAGTVISSTSYSVQSSTLSALGLLRNTTYHFRVASLNHAGALSSFTVIGATVTLAPPPVLIAEPFLMLGVASSTVRWAAFIPSPPQASSASAAGFVLEASSTNFGQALPGGVTLSSLTWSVLSTTLTVLAQPDLCVPTYFRVGSLNWAGAPNYTVISSTNAEDYGLVVSTRDLTIGGLNVNEDIVISTSFIISNPACPLTYWVKAATITAGSPWTISTTSGTDTFTLQALFHGTQPPATFFADDDKLTDSQQAATPARFSSGQSGVSVPYGQDRLLWLRIGMPKITSAEAQQAIRVTVYARPP